MALAPGAATPRGPASPSRPGGATTCCGGLSTCAAPASRPTSAWPRRSTWSRRSATATAGGRSRSGTPARCRSRRTRERAGRAGGTRSAPYECWSGIQHAADADAAARRRTAMGKRTADDPLIKIGAVVATRGPAALLGSSFVKAIQLAKDDLENTTHRYGLVIEEIPSPDRAEPAIEKLINIDEVDALIVGLSISGQIVKP